MLSKSQVWHFCLGLVSKCLATDLHNHANWHSSSLSSVCLIKLHKANHIAHEDKESGHALATHLRRCWFCGMPCCHRLGLSKGRVGSLEAMMAAEETDSCNVDCCRIQVSLRIIKNLTTCKVLTMIPCTAQPLTDSTKKPFTCSQEQGLIFVRETREPNGDTTADCHSAGDLPFESETDIIKPFHCQSVGKRAVWCGN